MQSVLSWIWTRVAVSISYDNNNYTTGTSKIDISSDASYLDRKYSQTPLILVV